MSSVCLRRCYRECVSLIGNLASTWTPGSQLQKCVVFTNPSPFAEIVAAPSVPSSLFCVRFSFVFSLFFLFPAFCSFLFCLLIDSKQTLFVDLLSFLFSFFLLFFFSSYSASSCFLFPKVVQMPMMLVMSSVCLWCCCAVNAFPPLETLPGCVHPLRRLQR